jgi:hypothetical protein
MAEVDLGELELPGVLMAPLISDGSRCSGSLDLGMNSSTQSSVKSSASRISAVVDAASWGWQHIPIGSFTRGAVGWPEETAPAPALAGGAGSASYVTGMALGRTGRLTITRPQMAGSALREARAAAVSAVSGAGAARRPPYPA